MNEEFKVGERVEALYRDSANLLLILTGTLRELGGDKALVKLDNSSISIVVPRDWLRSLALAEAQA